MRSFIQRLDQWLRSRIRQYIWKQWKKFKTKVTNLQKLGLSKTDAYTFASTRKGYWRTAHGKTLCYTLTNKKMESLGLINLSQTLQLIQKWLNCWTAVYGTVRTVVWEDDDWTNQFLLLDCVRPAWVLARRWKSAMGRSSRNHELRTRVSVVRRNLKEV